jgi:hypothetical protein
MNALEALQEKPREKRTPIEQCIVDATTFEEAEHDGEIELMEKAANDLLFMAANEESLITVNNELHKEIERLNELVARAQNDMTAIESRCLTKNREKAKSLEFVPILNIVSKWVTDENRANLYGVVK